MFAQMCWQGAMANGQSRPVECLVICKLEGASWKHDFTAIWVPEQSDCHNVRVVEPFQAMAVDLQQGRSSSIAAPLDVQNVQEKYLPMCRTKSSLPSGENIKPHSSCVSWITPCKMAAACMVHSGLVQQPVAASNTTRSDS